jgi:predicted alpha/beta hydrolase family esterase
MNKECLVLVSGIAGQAYSLKELKKNEVIYSKLVKRYGEDNIIEIDYQPIMDRHAILGDTILDPIRLLINPDGWAAERFVEVSLQNICKEYPTVNVITHSLGSWIILKCNAKINNLTLIASPIGFAGILGRHTVRLNIGKPKLKVFRLNYIWSSNDPVSCFPPKFDINGKWGLDATYMINVNTRTGHSLGEYLEYISKYKSGIIRV